jgi:hypothetical protein
MKPGFRRYRVSLVGFEDPTSSTGRRAARPGAGLTRSWSWQLRTAVCCYGAGAFMLIVHFVFGGLPWSG